MSSSRCAFRADRSGSWRSTARSTTLPCPARGGVASVLNELARASSVAMIVREGAVPVRPDVAGAAEILGIDPMYVANEGKLVAFVAPGAAALALQALRAVPGCEAAAEIGE